MKFLAVLLVVGCGCSGQPSFTLASGLAVELEDGLQVDAADVEMVVRIVLEQSERAGIDRVRLDQALPNLVVVLQAHDLKCGSQKAVGCTYTEAAVVSRVDTRKAVVFNCWHPILAHELTHWAEIVVQGAADQTHSVAPFWAGETSIGDTSWDRVVNEVCPFVD